MVWHVLRSRRLYEGLAVTAVVLVPLSVLGQERGTGWLGRMAAWERGEAARLERKASRRPPDRSSSACRAAESVVESLTRGMRVSVSGRLRQRSYETREGEKRTVYEVEVDDVGPSLRNASAKVNRMARVGGDGGFGDGQRSQGGGAEADPWAADASSAFSDEPPF